MTEIRIASSRLLTCIIDVLGCLYIVHPSQKGFFYLRLLLVNIRGSTLFQHLRTFNGAYVHTYKCGTYKRVFQRLGLLENDTQ